MFIRPNEFEVQLETTAAEAPAYTRPHRTAGLGLLMLFTPVTIAWLAALACWTIGAALLRAPMPIARFLCDAADFGGSLVLR